jgi:hypothetical protein
LAKQTGSDPYFGTGPEDLKRLVGETRPELVILDLSSTDYDPFSVAHELKMTFNSRLFGVYPHVRAELKKRADEIGFEYVVPNSNFLSSLRRVLLERAEDDWAGSSGTYGRLSKFGNQSSRIYWVMTKKSRPLK